MNLFQRKIKVMKQAEQTIADLTSYEFTHEVTKEALRKASEIVATQQGRSTDEVMNEFMREARKAIK